MKKNLNKNNLLKFKLFNLFKKKMEKNKIVWVVVGGLNNYPKQLGRDMDVVIKDKNKINKVQSIFKSCLKDLNINHIMYKEDFYGNLIIAFDKYNNYYELHICPSRISSGFFSVEINWSNLKPVGEYWINPESYIFKNYFSARKKNIKFLNKYNISKPLWLKLFLYFKLNEKKRNLLFFTLISLICILSGPKVSFLNSVLWFKKKIIKMKYAHSKIFFFKNKKIEKKTIKIVRKYFLGTWFRDVKNINLDNFVYKNIFNKFQKKKDNKIINFISMVLLFFISLNKDFTKAQMSFCYINNKNTNFNLHEIKDDNEKRIFKSILDGINY